MKNAPVYRSAEALGIEQWEHDGLAALVGPLSRNELNFDMKTWDCGTVRCIGGWMCVIAGVNSHTYFSPTDEMHSLFMPPSSINWNHITSQKAAKAIVNYLTMNDPRWDDVMREPADEIGAA